MALLDDVKQALRISNVGYNIEVTDLIESAKKDLEITGIPTTVILDTDPLIKRAITIYCKAHFGYNNPDADRLLDAYHSLKSHLCLSGDYGAPDVVE